MIDISIPGFGDVLLAALVCDYNGTLARDGLLLDHARSYMPRVAEKLRVHVITGDTFGTVRAELRDLPCEIHVLASEGQAEAKSEFVARLGAKHVVAIGNGRNDRLMLAAAALGIGVLGDEGLAFETQKAAQLTVRHVVDAFELLLNPRRLVASLRQ